MLVRMSRVVAALTAVMLGSLPVAWLYAADTDPDPLASGSGSVPKTGHGKPVFALIPYTYNPDTPVYVSYLDTYVIPQVKGWQQEGVATSTRLP